MRGSSSDQTLYTITDVSPDVMALIIHYIYTQEIRVTNDNLQDLTADRLLMRDLVRSCCNFLKAYLSLENCLGIWQYADADSYSELQDQTYVLHHFKDVVRTPSSKFLELNVEQLGGILQRDELNVKQEKMVIQAIIRWIEHEPDLRIKHIANLLLKIHICGGLNGTETLFTAECFMPRYDQWMRIKWMHIPRRGMGVIALNNRVFAVRTSSTESQLSFCNCSVKDGKQAYFC
ncbi:hypothetical protein AMELA_G00141460 [Ameiurus melas]|uniref:BACK domain-containing protein n=1 Tax=Ameiurus melas TaxID=219545 RepID=A0A7J6ALL4_AMEME|nr:hypothetical protein AMELA_G00141460 [Ameiurus melas]